MNGCLANRASHRLRRSCSGLPALILLCAAQFSFVPALRGQSSPFGIRAATIVLPSKVMAGHAATLSVLGADGKLTPGAAVELSTGQIVTTDSTGRAIFTAPSSQGVLIAHSSGVTAVALVDPATAASEPSSVSLPSVVSTDGFFRICAASLEGHADADHVTMNGQPALVLAASPDCLQVLPPLHAAAGPAAIAIEAPGVKWKASTTLVSLLFEPPQPALRPGQKGTLIVHLLGSREKLSLMIENRSPDVLHFVRGDSQQLRTSGGQQNSVDVKVQAIRSGDFSFHAFLVPAPDAAAASRYLEAAAALAPASSPDQLADSMNRQQQLLKLSTELIAHPHDSAKVARALDEILAHAPAGGDFRALLDAARSAL